MLVKAAGNVRNPDFPVAPDSPSPKVWEAEGDLVTDVSLGARELQSGVIAVAEQVERFEKTSCGDARRQLLQYCCCSSPVACRDCGVGQRVKRKIVVRIDLKRGIKGCQCFLVAMEPDECIATFHQDFRVLGPKRECTVICDKRGLNCSVVSICLGQGIGVIDARI